MWSFSDCPKQKNAFQIFEENLDSIKIQANASILNLLNHVIIKLEAERPKDKKSKKKKKKKKKNSD